MIHTYSLHKISNWHGIGFSSDEYSRFKFGDDIIAKKFGTNLAKGFINQYLLTEVISKQIVVIPSPYSFIPTATFALKDYFVFTLNSWLAENGMNVVQEAKVHRNITYKEDYGELNAEERMRLIGNDRFQIDKEFICGKALLFIDDIKITGSHEKMILKMVKEYGLTNEINLLYFAELTNPNIHPNIENHLNYHYIKSIFDLEDIIKSGYFKFNTRVVKYILNYELSTFSIFLHNQTDEFIETLYNMAIGNGYHAIPAYSDNLRFIKDHLFTKNLKTINHGN